MTITAASSVAATEFPFTADRSRQLHEEAKKVLPGGTSRLVHDAKPHPLYVREASGVYVTDVDGNRYIDFFNNASSLVHGHAHPIVTQAVLEQVQKGTAFALPSEPQIQLAQMIAERVSSVEQVRFTNSGSEAVLFAVKAARAHTGRHKIAKFEGLYHGCYDWVEVSLDSNAENMGSPERPASVPYNPGTPPGVLSDVVVLPFNDIDSTAALLREHGNQLAAVLVDVMPNQIGLVSSATGFLENLRELTRSLGILLICDEVINFRLDYHGAQGYAGFDADLTTFGKIIGGGFPVGAVAGPASLMAVFRSDPGRPKVPHAGTFNANPVTLVAGLATLSLLTPAEISRLNDLGAMLRYRLNGLFQRTGAPAHVTGAGSLFRVHMTANRFTNYRGWRQHVLADAEVQRRTQAFYVGLLARGILLSRGGMGAISTPMTEGEINTFVDAVEDLMADMGHRGGP